MRFGILIFTFLASISIIPAQGLFRKALFLGNSYTYVNNLPGLSAALANSAGDSLYFESNTPGGYTLGWQPIAHVTNAVSLAMIDTIGWDFVILQEQSQTPAIPALRDSCMYPASIILHDSVKSSNSCGRVLFFLTWGRRFGGIQCFNSYYCSPDFTDFDHMQDSLTAAYKGIADSLNSWISPVGEAWRLVLSTTSMVLHSPDNSHPSLNGSYLGACVFYACIFGKSPVGLPFTAGLLPDSALILQQAADSIVFGFASYWNLWNDQPVASFASTISGDTLFTENLSTGSDQWQWSFGDGTTSNAFEPIHIYQSPGTYDVKLIACDSCYCDSISQEVNILSTSISNIQYPTSNIKIIGPDAAGNIRFEGFTGNGFLTLYDISGRNIATIKVRSGKTTIQKSPQQLVLCVLFNDNREVVARGKILIN